MKTFFIALSIFALACGDPKKPEAKSEVKPEESKTEAAKEEKASSLDELVYEAVGISRLKTESAARGSAETNGRGALLKVLAEDAVAMSAKFAESHPDAFSGFEKSKMENLIREEFKKSITLKGSSVSEYTQSANKDTTYATMELPLMSGYEVIESVIVEAGTKGKMIKDAEIFRKSFKAFYMDEKKKALTVPS